MKKTKIFAITLAAVLLVVSAVGSTLAWFTATDEEINEMELKNLQVDIYEEFGNHYEVVPGTEVQKNPKIINNSQSEIDEYVRVKFDVENFAKTAYATEEVYMTVKFDFDNNGEVETYNFYEENAEGVVVPVAGFDATQYADVTAAYDAYKASVAAGELVNYDYAATVGYTYSEDLANSFAANAGTPEYTAWVATVDAAIDAIVEDAIAEIKLADGVTDAWYKAADGYYYYNGVLEYGAENGVYFFESLNFDGAAITDDYQGVNFDIRITAEAIQAEGTYVFGDVAGLAAQWNNFVNP